eukprot:TRINITY_DN758_c0_g1_i1.p1 TRINITY_DN758_c0_g1~~TRINITY_DN758_c0_g1_i1.p1  ORF type:complete len:491 (-),score=62.16 TRINITY_DN758_c0_g1_i1:260-1657(-)
MYHPYVMTSCNLRTCKCLYVGFVVLSMVRVQCDVASISDGDIVSPCTPEDLKTLLEKHRNKAWVCRGFHIRALDSAPWDQWVWDDPQFLKYAEIGLVRPRGKDPDALGKVYDTFQHEYYWSKRKRPPLKTGRPLLEEAVKPGTSWVTFAHDFLREQKDFMEKLEREVGHIAGGLINEAVGTDSCLYGGHVGEKKKARSFGWHTDYTDAALYPLQGKKHLRIAGYSPGSEVIMDTVIGPGDFALVPAVRYHNLLSVHDGSPSSIWVSLISLALFTPNTDLAAKFRESYDHFDQTIISWSDQAAIEKRLPHNKPEMLDFWKWNAYDKAGYAAMHRVALSEENSRGRREIFRHLNSPQAEVDLLTLHGHPTVGKDARLTALGLAICCGPTELLAEFAEAVLLSGANASQVGINTTDGSAIGSLDLAARRSPKHYEEVAEALRQAADVAKHSKKKNNDDAEALGGDSEL